MVLENVLRYINNRFERSFVSGTFSIEDGALDVVGALDGQYVWLEGSALNDGLHQYPLQGLSDEEFDGAVWLLAVPPAVVSVANEIEAWTTAHADAIGSPLSSESFGGYSYTRASGGATGNEVPPEAWQLQFGAKLRPWKKLSRDWV